MVLILVMFQFFRQWHRCFEYRRLFAFETGSEVLDASTLHCTPSCTPLLFISNFSALGYFAVFQSPLYYYLVPDLDMQSKGHAICATLVLQQCLFHDAQNKKPYNCEPGDPWLKFSQHTSKMFFILIVRSPPINVIAKTETGHIKTIILMWLQAT